MQDRFAPTPPARLSLLIDYSGGLWSACVGLAPHPAPTPVVRYVTLRAFCVTVHHSLAREQMNQNEITRYIGECFFFIVRCRRAVSASE